MALTGRWPRRPLIAAGIVLLAILVIAVVDHTITAASLPEVGPFTLRHPASSDPDVAERIRLRDGFVTRAWIYALACIATVATLVIVGLRSSPRARWRELFTDLGVAGVSGLGLASVLSLSGPELLDEVSKAPVWIAPVLMVAAAAIGTLLTRRREEPVPAPEMPAAEGWASVPGAAPGRMSPPLGRIALGLGAVTVLLVAVLGATANGADCGDRSGAWVGVVLLGALGGGICVGVCGLVALTVRRWVLSLASVSFAIVALLFAVAETIGGCLD